MKKFLPRTYLDKLLFIVLCMISIGLFGSLPVSTHTPTQTTYTLEKFDPFDTLSLNAYAAYVWDIKEQRVIYEKNAETPLPLASITKLMTALVALRTMNESTTIRVTAEHIKEEGDSGLLVNETWPLKQLIEFTLISSSNDGARAIASSPSFINDMNQTAHELNLTSMTFNNPTGLDVHTAQPGGSGSARDVARLYEYILEHYPSLLNNTNVRQRSVSSNQYAHTITNTNIITDKIPGLIASKTGFSDLAGGNLAVIIDIDLQHPIVLVVLHSTPEQRFTDILTLSEATRQAYNQAHHD